MKFNRWASLLMVLWWGTLVKGEPVVELSPYEVEAWHFDGLGMELPASVLRLERVEIEDSGAGSVPELLQRLAGIRFREFTGTGVEGQVALRGFGDNSGLRVLVLVDGQVYNPPDMGGINWLGLDMGELEMVEVLRGGQTVLYGNHAVAGVIKLSTRVPGAEIEGRMNGGWGSDGQFQTGMALGRKLGEVGLRGGGSWRESDGYRKNSSYEGKNAFLGWHIGERGGHEWSGRFTYSDVEAQFPGPLTYEQFQTDPRQSTNGGKDFSRSEDWQATASGEGQAALGKWQVKGGLLERMRRADLEGVHTDNRQRQGTLSPRIRKDLTGGFLIAGADLAYDQVDFMEFLGEEREINRALADIWRVTVGGYLFGSSDIGQGWTLSGGLRLETAGTDNDYRRFKEEQLSPVIETNRATVPNPAYRNPPEIDPGESFSGRVEKSGWAAELSLMHKLSDGLHVWGGWDRVYRYPALDETAAYQGFPLSDPLNEELDPETGNNFEIGIKRFESNWHASASVFLLLLDDEISFNEEERLNINIGNTERKGIEIETGYRQYRYGIVFHGSLVEAGFRDPGDGGDLPLVPSVEASATVWVKPVSEVRLQVSARYLSSQVQGNDFGNSFRRIPAYGIVDVSFQWNPTPHVALSGGIDNIFDRKHAVAAYSGGFYPGSGRQAHIRLKYVF